MQKIPSLQYYGFSHFPNNLRSLRESWQNLGRVHFANGLRYLFEK